LSGLAPYSVNYFEQLQQRIPRKMSCSMDTNQDVNFNYSAVFLFLAGTLKKYEVKIGMINIATVRPETAQSNDSLSKNFPNAEWLS
jgi:hypothetical protein